MSKIEGEKLVYDQVRLPITKWSGLDISGLVPADGNLDGVVEMMQDAMANYAQPLTEVELIFTALAKLSSNKKSIQKRKGDTK